MMNSSHQLCTLVVESLLLLSDTPLHHAYIRSAGTAGLSAFNELLALRQGPCACVCLSPTITDENSPSSSPPLLLVLEGTGGASDTPLLNSMYFPVSVESLIARRRTMMDGSSVLLICERPHQQQLTRGKAVRGCSSSWTPSTAGGRVVYCWNDVQAAGQHQRNIIPYSTLQCSQATDITVLDNINHTITTIGHSFCLGSGNLTRVNLSSMKNVTSVQHSFLYRCYKLEVVDLSGGGLAAVETIGDNFMYWCSRVSSLQMKIRACAEEGGRAGELLSPNAPMSNMFLGVNLVSIGDSFLEGCSMLESIDLSCCVNLTTIGHSFMKNCRGLVSANIEGMFSVSTIGHSFMLGNRSLVDINLSSLQCLQSVGDSFLEGCVSLRVHRPTSLPLTGTGAASRQTPLSNLCLPVPLIG